MSVDYEKAMQRWYDEFAAERARRLRLRQRVRVALQWLDLDQPDALAARIRLREALAADDKRRRRLPR